MKKTIFSLKIVLPLIVMTLVILLFVKGDAASQPTLKSFEQLTFGMSIEKVRSIVGVADMPGLTGRHSDNYFAYDKKGNQVVLTLFYQFGALVQIIVQEEEPYDLLERTTLASCSLLPKSSTSNGYSI